MNIETRIQFGKDEWTVKKIPIFASKTDPFFPVRGNHRAILNLTPGPQG
jgi:hypothetical protein